MRNRVLKIQAPVVILCVPVRVAKSTMISDFKSLLAYATPSPRTSLPSASVLFTSDLRIPQKWSTMKIRILLMNQLLQFCQSKAL